MALIWVTVTLGSKRVSGARNVNVNRNTAQASDVTVCIDNAVVKTKGDLLECCKAAADHLGLA